MLRASGYGRLCVMNSPADPIAAVTHPDPYPYYSLLVAERPMAFDSALGCWVATSATACAAALASERCRVRPVAEPVPPALAGLAAGSMWSRWARMTDGPGHLLVKRALAATLADSGSRIEAHAGRAARALLEGSALEGGARIDHFLARLSSHALAPVLGFDEARCFEVAEAVIDLVRGTAPEASPEALARGEVAARELGDRVRGFASRSRPGDGACAAALAHRLEREGLEDGEVAIANAIALLWQATDATAGWIGNSMVALARHTELRSAVMRDRRLLDPLLAEVLRWDPPVQNTRRFVATAGPVAGAELAAHDTVLVVLAAANRDPRLNADPARFDVSREARRSLTFGHGPHACPGDVAAAAIARAGVNALLDEPNDWDRMAVVRYRPSRNVRVPEFAG